MSRTRKIVFILAGLFVLLGLIYAGSPAIITILVKQELSRQGLTDVGLELGYPTLDGIRIHRLQGKGSAGGHDFVLQIKDAVIDYHVPELLDGSIGRIHVTSADIALRPMVPDRISEQATARFPLAGFVPGRWLPLLPVRSLAVDRLHVEHQPAPGVVYVADLSGDLQEDLLQLQGELRALNGQFAPLRITAFMNAAGELGLSFVAPDELLARSVLSLGMQLAARDAGTIHSSGSLEVELATLAAFMDPWFATTDLLPGVQGVFKSHWRGTLPDEFSPTLEWFLANAQLSSQNKLELTAQRVGDFAGDADVYLEARVDLSEGRAQWQLAKTSRFAGQLQSAKTKNQPLAITFPAGFAGELKPLEKGFDLSFQQGASIATQSLQLADAEIPDSRLTLNRMTTLQYDPSSRHWRWEPIELSLAGSPIRWQENIIQNDGISLQLDEATGHGRQWDIKGRLTATGIAGHAGEQKFPRSELQARFQVQSQDDAVRVSLQQGTSIVAQPFKLGETAIPSSRLNLTSPASLHYQLSSRHWRWTPLELSLAASLIKWQDNIIAYKGISLKLDEARGKESEWRAKGILSATDVSGSIADHPLPNSNARVDFKADNRSANATLELATSDGTLTLKADVVHDWLTGDGQLRANLRPVLLNESGSRLAQLSEYWPDPLMLNGGQIAAGGEVVWRKADSPEKIRAFVSDETFNIQFDGVAGRYGETRFEGLNSRFALADLDALHTTKRADVSLALVDAGIPIENAAAQIELETDPATGKPVVTMRDLHADLLGGKAFNKEIHWNPAQPTQAFMLHLEHLELLRILQLEQQEGLQGSGLIDGSLPVAITAEGVTVSDGQLRARHPGHIRYRPNETAMAMAESNPAMKQVFQILSNFQYDKLNASTDYTPDGDLALLVRLEGKNPEYRSGQPVNLNLTVEENIPDLLRSLQITDELIEEIGEGVQQRSLK